MNRGDSFGFGKPGAVFLQHLAEHVKIGAVVWRAVYGEPNLAEIPVKLRKDVPISPRNNVRVVAKGTASERTEHQTLHVVCRRNGQDFVCTPAMQAEKLFRCDVDRFSLTRVHFVVRPLPQVGRRTADRIHGLPLVFWQTLGDIGIRLDDLHIRHIDAGVRVAHVRKVTVELVISLVQFGCCQAGIERRAPAQGFLLCTAAPGDAAAGIGR